MNEEYEKSELEIREFIRDYFNGHNSKEEIYNEFNLKECDKCNQIELLEDLEDTEETLGIGYICQQCKEDL